MRLIKALFLYLKILFLKGHIEMKENQTSVPKVVLTLVGSLVFIITLFSSCSTITPGNTGVIFNVWTGSLRTVSQGLVFRTPFVTNVQSYPTALRTYTMVKKGNEGSEATDDSLDLPTQEGQHIKQDLSVTYNTSPDKAADVFKSFRGQDIEDIEKTFIRRTIITVAQNVSGQMKLQDVISDKRDLLQNSIQKLLSVELVKMGFTVDKVNLGASHLPATIEQQMQQKMAAQQMAQQSAYEKQKQENLAQAAIAQAHGEAEAMEIRAQGQANANKKLQATLTPALIQAKAIDKWNGEMPQIVGGNGTVPFINIKTSTKGSQE